MKRHRRSRIGAAIVGVAFLPITAGCVPDPAQPPGYVESAPAVPTQQADAALHARLPEAIRGAGKLVIVNQGSFPPYVILSGTGVSGATWDLAQAIGGILGVQIQPETADSLGSVLSGMQAKRYDLALGPVGDTPARQKQATFVDWIDEHVLFAVRAGNPTRIDDLDSTCGQRIAVQSAGSAEIVITKQSERCVETGRSAVIIQNYKDQPSSILAVQAGRADGFFSSQSPLTYFVKQAGGDLELAGEGHSNGFGDLHQGALLPIGSPLIDILVEALHKLQANGTYAAILTKWGLSTNMTNVIGINKAKS